MEGRMTFMKEVTDDFWDGGGRKGGIGDVETDDKTGEEEERTCDSDIGRIVSV